jgi:hypothetical protein
MMAKNYGEPWEPDEWELKRKQGAAEALAWNADHLRQENKKLLTRIAELEAQLIEETSF